MKLDPSHFCYLTNTEFRVLTAIEIGMRNHQYIPVSLITTMANLRSVGMTNVISSLLKAKLIVHCGKVYDGYKLTFLGLDYLALRALSKRGVIASVGRRIGVGKEADVHLCKDTSDNLVVLKFHRLGRISFRSVKNNRDYMGNRKHASWMYLSQLAAKKEYSYLSNLYDESFPVPEPIDFNRHVIAMRYIDGIPLSQVREMGSPKKVLHIIMSLIVKLARLGIIHGDFNDFNLMINEEGNKVTVIDFPQVVSVYHENAEFYFDRDVRSVVEMFKRKFKIDVVEFPKFSDVVKTVDQSKVEKLKVDISSLDNEFLNDVFQNLRQEAPEGRKDADQVAEDMDDLKIESEYYDIKELSSDEDLDKYKQSSDADEVSENISYYTAGDVAYTTYGDMVDADDKDMVDSNDKDMVDSNDKDMVDGDDDDLENNMDDANDKDMDDGSDDDAICKTNGGLKSDNGHGESDEDDSDYDDYEDSENGDRHEDGDGDGESEEGDDDGDKREGKKHIQIWKPHVKRVGNRAYGRRLKSKMKNKAKSESKKDRKQRKIKDSINNIRDVW